MNLLDLLIPASLDAKQALRLRRFGVAALNYVLATALAAFAWGFGELAGIVVMQVVAAFVVINVGVYAAIRSGFNLRFSDPSLTRFQMMAAISVLMYIVYHMDHGRDIALFGCFIVFLFGVFRLETREFVGVTLFTLAAHALVINLLMHWRPEAIHDVPSEWMSWMGLAGFLPCFVIIGGQINALRRTLRERVARSRSLAGMSSDFHWETDAQHRLTDRSLADEQSGAAPMFQRGVQIGERRWDIPYLSPDDAGWAAHRAVLDAHLPFRNFESSRLGADGTERHVSLSGDPVFDPAGEFKGYRGVGAEITARKRAEERSRHLAHHDSLTGLPNRLLFHDRLAQEIALAKRGSRPFALLFLDLDRFKLVNDAHGHTAGDELLKAVAARIRQQVRESDTVARVGGDEFTVILPNTGRRDQAEVIARKIVSALTTPFPLPGRIESVEIGTSVGIAIYPDDAADADELVKAADRAMYLAKQAGTNVPPLA